MIFMRPILLALLFYFLLNLTATSQISSVFSNPKVRVNILLSKNTFKLGEDIRLTIALKNETKQVQSVWFDRPKLSTGGPACTSVTLINKKTGKSVLKYQNKAILISQVFTNEQVKKFSYQLKPSQIVKGQFSLYDMVVIENNDYKLSKGEYIMQVLYGLNSSDKISFIID